ncbi:MAG TPA: RiPP maturation radical SAM C-methyltransferase [Gammaproteobacteria bacterium]|nr:RiPP maturation radical SAM C-methyltransferase [Gammaproteobacteria bacterium]
MKLKPLRPDASFGLVAMPWFWSTMPSIQIGIVRQLLADFGTTRAHEFYVDLADQVGFDLYEVLAMDSGFVAERLFSLLYYAEGLEHDQAKTPFLGVQSKEVEDALFTFLPPIIDDLMEKWIEELSTQNYDAVFFSLTINQNAASMLMAKRLKERRPDLPIIFGGSSCAGPMGRALAAVCPEADVVVHGEAEVTLPHLMKALQQPEPDLSLIPAISWRDGDEIRTNPRPPLHNLQAPRNSLYFGDYFKRVEAAKNLDLNDVWIPFESSRGCWYGTYNQCTFCGLNEIITYRERNNDALVDELASYQEQYDSTQFFCVDLIMPMHFFKDVLPRLQQEGKDWSIFYEIKANLKREQIAQLAKSGIRRIQPGIESLHDDVLKLMKKGVSALQNIQTLKWGKQYGIDVGWNIITGFPGETAAVYEDMAALIPKLHHLQPPVDCGDFQVHRFSPCFTKPAEHGIRVLGSDRRYRFVYPVDDVLLDDLVYRFEYELLPEFPSTNGMKAPLHTAFHSWQEAVRRGAAFEMIEHADGSFELIDSRASETPIRTHLRPEEASLLVFLDNQRSAENIPDQFERYDTKSFAALGGRQGIQELITQWENKNFLVRIGSRVAALPTWKAHEQQTHAHHVKNGGTNDERSYAQAS